MTRGETCAATITSINLNPGNESKYARRRSIWKGKKSQLASTVAALQGTPGVNVYQYLESPFLIDAAVSTEWGISLNVSRAGPRRGQILGSWVVRPPSWKILEAAGALQGDLKLLWDDFSVVTGRRIGISTGAGADNSTDYNGKSLLLFAFGRSRFDIIMSKYGYGENLKRDHHFFQWQARAKGFEDLVNVDNYEGEEGLTFYVVS